MATVTPGKVFTSNEIVTPTNLNALGVPTVSNIVTADLADSSVTTVKIANGAVTQEKLNSSVTLVPTGAIMPFAMNSAPSGWLAANGNEYSKTGTYAALFAAIGTTYGETNGAGVSVTGGTHFRVPDLRGYFVRGAGTNTDGTASGTFGQKQADSVGPHTHTGTIPNHQHNIIANATGSNAPYTSINIDNNDYLAARAESSSTPDWSYTLRGVSTTATLGLTSSNGAQTITTSSQSPSSTTETRPDNIALLYCIKA